MSISSAERNRVLEIIQYIAYANSEEAYKVNLILSQNTKLHTVVDFFMENWKSIKEQWVMFYKDQSFNFGETTNNGIESTFRLVKNFSTQYASSIQFFNEFFSVLKTFRNHHNHSCLMALHRKSTKLEGLHPTLQEYHESSTPYGLTYIERQWELRRTLDNVTLGHNTTVYGCECTLMKSMGLSCKHLLKKRLQEQETLFDKKLLKTGGHSVIIAHLALKYPSKFFSSQGWSQKQASKCNRKEKIQFILSQAQKFKKAVYLSQEIASLASEGGMKMLTEQYAVLLWNILWYKDIVKLWKLDEDIRVLCSVNDSCSAERDSKNLIIESEC